MMKIPRSANAPSSQARILVRQQLAMKFWIERAAADHCPQGVHAGFVRRRVVEHQFFQHWPRRRILRFVSLGQHSRCRLAEIDIPAMQPLDELLIGLFRQIKNSSRRRVLVPQPIEPAVGSIDAVRIAARILIAMILVVPIENIEAAVGPDALGDRHEPGVVGGEQVGVAGGAVRRTVAVQHVDIQAIAVDVAHHQFVAIFRRQCVAVEVLQAAIGRLLMMEIDDRRQFPSERRIGPALAMVIAGFGQMPQMIDDTGADERASFADPKPGPTDCSSLRRTLRIRAFAD